MVITRVVRMAKSVDNFRREIGFFAKMFSATGEFSRLGKNGDAIRRRPAAFSRKEQRAAPRSHFTQLTHKNVTQLSLGVQ